MFKDILKRPFGGRRWESDFVEGEITNKEIQYAIFLIVLTLVPAAIMAYVSVEPQWKVFALFFSAPLQAVVSGFLTSSLLFAFSYLVKKPRSFEYSFRVMFRVMAIYPFLRIFVFNQTLFAMTTLLYGFLVVRAAVKSYSVSVRNAALFLGSIWFVFFLMQVK